MTRFAGDPDRVAPSSNDALSMVRLPQLSVAMLSIAVAAIVGYNMAFGLFVVERMGGGLHGWTELFFQYRAAALVVLALAVAIAIHKVPTNGMVAILAIMVAVGAAVGLTNLGAEYVATLIQAITALLGYAVGVVYVRQQGNVERLWSAASYLYLAAVPLLFYAFFSSVTHPIPHYSLNFHFLVIPFAFFLVRRNFVLAALTMVLIVACGKRSVLISGMVMVLWFLVTLRPRNSILLLLFGAAAALASVGASFVLGAGEIWAVAVERYFDWGNNLNELSSHRGDLIISVFASISQNPFALLIGSGFGASYQFEFLDRSVAFYGVDIMPLHFVWMYGVPLAALLFAAIGKVLWGAKARIGSADPGARSTMVASYLMVLGYLVNYLFSYTPTDPVFWFLLAVSVHCAALSPGRDSSAEHRSVVPERNQQDDRGGGAIPGHRNRRLYT